MSKPIVIRQVKGAIATIVLYLRRGKKISPELRSKAIQMAEKKTKGKKFGESHQKIIDDQKEEQD
ncbi:hypothetical protein LCGC14_2641700 [marine sediment metagenome]|uniref:Uncharacterized protein n=1 Tax=marine sediment metagenome TaxID=412755 RepID=A0A0F8ZXH1_9ZZZZ